MAFWNKISNRGKVEDRRSLSGAAVGSIGIGGIALYLVFSLLTGGDINVGGLANQLQNLQSQQVQGDTTQYEGQDEYEVFASTVLGSNNSYWQNIFNGQNKTYVEPKLVLFRQGTQSECGGATSDVGPHYCPLDETIYLDETFFDELTNRFGARGGDVAQAYVIAHEVGHHTQSLLSELDANSNEDQIGIELQADCFAGLWANSIKDQGIFEEGEIEEALDAAKSVGDDRIHEATTGVVNPENWTHGSSTQRLNAFTTGYNTGDFNKCSF